MRTIAAVILVLVFIALPAFADDLVVKQDETLKVVLSKYEGKTVTVHLASGQEMTGIVRETTDTLVHLGALAGKEYYDAVVQMTAIEAIIVRTKK